MVLLAELTTSYLSKAWYATLPLWPLLGAALVGVLVALRCRPERSHWPVVIGTLLSAILGITVFFDLQSHYGTAHETEAVEAAGAVIAEEASAQDPDVGFTHTVYRWMSFGQERSLDESSNQWIEVNFFFDGLTGVMLLFFTVVAAIIVIYSIGYMRDHHGHPERGYERFFAFMGIFVFSMAVLVMAGNFVLLYLGWELVGLCSYLLIGFYYKRPSAAAAAKKAFLVNRIGDLGFALGIFALYWFLTAGQNPLAQPGENPLDYAVVFRHIGALAPWQVTLVAMLLMCGALGKSAQFPLYVWLPDAMEGPTPVSALIHAATMVTAGVYMIARCSPIFAASQITLDVIITLGAIGALLTATMAMAQYDMKRILAYSTISQLAYMFVALGCQAPDSAIFHVFTHAWFKALLFLAAGSVMHQMGGVIDLRKFSGLRHVLPQTYRVMLIGCLALAGFPLLAGFWSKDEIVHAAFHNCGTLVGIVMLGTAGLTAYYTFRMFFLCFHGKLRLPEEAGEHPHESPPVMILPLWILAIGAIFTGYLGVTIGTGSGAFLGFLQPHGLIHGTLGHSTIGAVDHAEGGAWLMYVSAAVALAGILLAAVRYGKAPEVDPDQRLLGPVFKLWHAKYYVDELYDRVLVRPLRGLGHLCFGTDRFGVDGLVWLVAAVPRGLAFGLHFVQRGALQVYALGMVLGLAVLLLLWGFFQGPSLQ